MADKRMFSRKIVESDPFLDMPLSSQALYFHLCLFADDDGVVNSPRRVIKTIGASEDDIKILLAKKFLIPFDSGVVVVKHWRINNYIRKDRYTPSDYLDEMRQLGIKENGAYTTDPDMVAIWYTDGTPSIDKNRVDKNRVDGQNGQPKYDPSNNPKLDEERLRELLKRRSA